VVGDVGELINGLENLVILLGCFTWLKLLLFFLGKRKLFFIESLLNQYKITQDDDLWEIEADDLN
jgi:hypothetical protein